MLLAQSKSKLHEADSPLMGEGPKMCEEIFPCSAQLQMSSKHGLEHEDEVSRLVSAMGARGFVPPTSVFLPSSHKQLRAKKINPGNLDFLWVGLPKQKRKKTSGIMILFRKRGLLLWLMHAQRDHYTSECKTTSG